ncbi:hypothetical protein CEXT_595671 [Caerostris extrusa]|uniref:Uncharacterized protein n=1 Tax=Caerostris extrusa TaxID=172846 RepID=A0AAV4Y0K4_CAEEX|nr:hypothetical protein CEXT_595671 [Caerostris extrusa]
MRRNCSADLMPLFKCRMLMPQFRSWQMTHFVRPEEARLSQGPLEKPFWIQAGHFGCHNSAQVFGLFDSKWAHFYAKSFTWNTFRKDLLIQGRFYETH